MLVVIGDTHGTDGHRLTGTVLDSVRQADRVVHTGDFTREPVLDALQAEAGDLLAVAGNNDNDTIKARLPEIRTFESLGRRFVVVHGHRQNDTARSLLARDKSADVIIVGHSHRPAIRELGEVIEVNPGSYANPRGHDPAFATFERLDGEPVVRILRSDGSTVERATV